MYFQSLQEYECKGIIAWSSFFVAHPTVLSWAWFSVDKKTHRQSNRLNDQMKLSQKETKTQRQNIAKGTTDPGVDCFDQ